MNKIKAFALAALLVAAPVYAQEEEVNKPRLCADLSMRLVAFNMVANFASSQEQYDSYMYKKLVEGGADRSTQELVVKLIKLAWTNKGKDSHALGMKFYDMCTNDGVGV